MPTKLVKAAPVRRLIGYAQVSTEDQGADPQFDDCALQGCATGSRGAPPAQTGTGWCWLACCARSGPRNPGRRPSRPPRSVGHLLTIIEQHEAASAHFPGADR
jgi:hypothetical protein